ncbi:MULTISPECIES: hypothetical protein [Prochlorococcus]|uniref:hypothetical protein n=1 Tax=Prochlorococcus TaxID=1218 RepID=UPI0005339EB7|nr:MULTISPECIES: hypothetical protein [Prochlorococcus]KGG12728.1 hypothetical protein EV05_1946 [Prochlorococcus sp. MIT 0601]
MKLAKIPGLCSSFLVTRKLLICLICGKKQIKPALSGLLTLEAFESEKFYIIGCEPDIPTPRDWC